MGDVREVPAHRGSTARAHRVWVVVNDEWLGPMGDAEALACTERLRARLRQYGFPTDRVRVVSERAAEALHLHGAESLAG